MKQKKTRVEMEASAARKEANRRAHSKPGTYSKEPERKKHIITQKR